MTPLLFLPSVFIVPAMSYWLPHDGVRFFISFVVATFVLRPSDNNVFLHPAFIVPAMCYWLRNIGLSLFLSFALAILELKPADNNAINKVTPNADQPKATPPSPITDPDIEILVTNEQTSDGAQTQAIQGLDSTSRKTVCIDLVFRPKFVSTNLPCLTDVKSISPTTLSRPTNSALPSQPTEPVLPSASFDLVMPKIIPSFSESIDWNYDSPAHQSKSASFMPASCLAVDIPAKFAPALPSTEKVLPSTSFDFVLPKHISSVSESINWNLDSPARQSKGASFMPASYLAADIPAEFASSALPNIHRSVSITQTPQCKHPKRILPPAYSDTFVPAEVPSPLSPSSPSMDRTISEFVPDMKLDPQVQAVREKIAMQLKVLEENKARVNKAAEKLQAARARDSKHRRRVKAKKKAEKALQISVEKLDELRLEEESL
ncbi:hypothetical protein MMC22_004798 [Lobaria immixta]|nr:hypothetical protein [Lobaria immixta]